MEFVRKCLRVPFENLVAEFFGTAVFLFVGCSGCLYNEASISFGMGLMIAAQIFGHVSGGHFNPAVTVASLIFKLLAAPDAVLYIIFQLLGATSGYSLAMYMAPDIFGTRDPYSNFCNTIPSQDAHISFLYEFLSTLFLILLCCSIWDARNEGKRDSATIKLGFFLMATVTIVGPMTGASLNPARTFGPSIVNNNWSGHWIYWVAPLLAGILGSLFYKYVLINKSARS